MIDILFKQNKKGGGLFNFIIPNKANSSKINSTKQEKNNLINVFHTATNTSHFDEQRKL